MRLNLNMYVRTFKMGIRDSVEYRFNIITTCIMNFFPIIVNFFLWKAIYLSRGAEVNDAYGITLNQLITYIIVVQIINLFVETSNVDYRILNEIRQGDISKYLIKPINYFVYNLVLCISKAFIYFLPLTIVSIILKILFNDYIVIADTKAILLFLLLLVNAFIIKYTISFICGMIGYFIDDISQLYVIFGTIFSLLSGFAFPLFFLPSPLLAICRVLPFYYIGYFPCSVLVGIETSPSDILLNVMLSLGWTFSLVVLSGCIWRKGQKKYSTYGG